MTIDQNTIVDGDFLVKGSSARISNDKYCEQKQHRLLVSDTSLSFWGGIDPLSGRIIDTTHPLLGETVTDTILCLPSGRGSCTASQVLLELILNDRAPTAIVLRDVDGLVCVGAIIAQEVFRTSKLDILCVGKKGFDSLLQLSHLHENNNDNATQQQQHYGSVSQNGALRISQTAASTKDDQDEHNKADETIQEISDEEKIMLTACATEAERMALRVIFRYSKLVCPPSSDSSDDPAIAATTNKYLPIQQAHIDGCTYIGPGGLAFVQELVAKSGQVKVPTTLNSVSADRRRWKELGVPEQYASNSIRLGDAYVQLGCQPSFTCAPYLRQHHPPQYGQDIAWGESNAVVYANSCLGARTEKYADYLDICCAIAGIVPATGVHLQHNRLPTILLDATNLLQQIRSSSANTNNNNNANGQNDDNSDGMDLDLLYPTLGHLCGTLSDGHVPILVGFDNNSDWDVTKDHLKSFCAAFGTTSASPLIHIHGITPEATTNATTILDTCSNNVREVTMEQLTSTFATLDEGKNDNLQTTTATNSNDQSTAVNLIALGNPHLSVTECGSIAKLIQRKGNTSDGTSSTSIADTTRVLACISRNVYDDKDNAANIGVMEQFGIEFVHDTCWCMLLDEPIIPTNTAATILTNSGKYAHYGPGLTNRSFRFGSMADCISAARTGVYPRRTTTDKNSLLSLQQQQQLPPPLQQGSNSATSLNFLQRRDNFSGNGNNNNIRRNYSGVVRNMMSLLRKLPK